ncbi:hypothetical protein CKAN_01792800 [Cinnamomum micranthum f. kanehirae]|uniref:Protein TILLER ANGLE CONTROL 1 n=1 Tax=Cinnamomum micranthum f. kanehirae TaxID=337451 RepID=A0A3S3MYV5_9MAGN|nr:hypothetical protein CKAN_01792800 [Cinnamomum micranthum f. kanehirae]
MKIFNWMHRKFHRNVDYLMVTPNKDLPDEKSTCDQETKALLHQGHVALIDALDDWQDGILAIGTFGLDHFPFSEAEYLVPEQQVSVTKGETGDEEVERYLAVVMKEPDEAFVTNNESYEKAKEVMEEESSGSVASVIGADAVPDDPVRQFVPMEEICSSDDADKEKMKKKGERTTLADLFSADAAAGKCNAEDEKIPIVCVKNQSERRTKHVKSLAKKLVPWKGEDSRPTAKLHRLLTKILKRKIHPELNSQVHGAVGDKSAPSSAHANGKATFEQEMIDINRANKSVSVV